ncbi:putative UDP-rhamnose:rhamnosyltransferase 1 [Acorus gramineus]|uniref:UDP-rhamnose:rhamnosyltransferase 1 n=1 Tax=Acorus gramineus TaxID=55184 RepID=A0AAV9BJT1_ACOGR|nr:putative UDP-rhamnose:rhamnosyltransferase 1 [Acorus gramineus]
MFPWLASGHLIPFLELSNALARKGHIISYITTPRNLTGLPPNLSPLINLIGFPLPAVDHLPPDADLTIDLPSNNLRPYLRIAYDGLEPQLSAFLDSSSPDWLILGYAPYWAARARRALRVLQLLLRVLPRFLRHPVHAREGSGPRPRNSPCPRIGFRSHPPSCSVPMKRGRFSTLTMSRTIRACPRPTASRSSLQIATLWPCVAVVRSSGIILSFSRRIYTVSRSSRLGYCLRWCQTALTLLGMTYLSGWRDRNQGRLCMPRSGAKRS